MREGSKKLGNPRWLIGLLCAFVLLTIIGNIIEGADALTAQQVAHIQAMQESGLTEAKDPDTGGVVTYGSTPKAMIDAILSAITMDWPWLYDIDDATGEQTPNSFYIIWAIIYWPIMIGILFELFVLALRLIRGV